MSKLSVQLYSVREAFAADPDAALARLAEIGFTQVEPFGLTDNVAALRTGLPKAGLTAPTTHCKLVGVDQSAVFAAAAEIGVQIVIDPAVREEHWQTLDDVASTAEALNAAAAVAATHGLTVGYHNHWWELQAQLGGHSALEEFASLLDPAVVLQVDTYWSTVGGADSPALLRTLGSKVKAIHVKDGDLTTEPSAQLPAGQGQAPVAEILAAAPDALWVLEFDGYAGDIFEGLAASYAYVSGLAR
jgi:sugar phosphate isomerase/epimerase